MAPLVHIDGTPGKTVIVSHYYLSHAFCTFTSCHLPFCSRLNSLWLFSPTFGAHRILSLKTTPMMPPRRVRQRLHPDEEPLQESTSDPTLHQPSTQTDARIRQYPTFGNTTTARISTTIVGPSRNDDAVNSSQTSEVAPCQSPAQAPSPE
jgi:hypothetical protein